MTLGLPVRLPAAVVFAWPQIGAAPEAIAARHGVQRVRDGVWARLPLPGDGATLDSALAFASECVAAEGGRAVLVPARARITGSQLVLTEEPFLEALERATTSPGIADGVLLTGRAAAALDEPWALVPAGRLALDARHTTPLWRHDPSLPTPAPAPRNRKLPFQVGYLPRPELAGLAQPGRHAVVGPLGCGKTRAIVEILNRRRGARAVGLRPAPRATSLQIQLGQILGLPANPGLDQLLHALARPELEVLFVDGLEHATESDLEIVLALLTSHGPESVILAGRPGPWVRALGSRWSILGVPPLDADQGRKLTHQLAVAAGLPRPAELAFEHACGGSPWALEEGLIEILHRREISDRLGTPFFLGGGDGEWHPSWRLAGHAFAEAGRLDPDDLAAALLVAALGNAGARPDHVEEAASTLALPAPNHGWAQRLGELGLLTTRQTSWGEGSTPSCTAWERALLDPVLAEGRRALREALGVVLAGHSKSGAEAWASWRLLRGTAEGPHALLAAVAERSKELAPGDVIDAALEELVALRQRGNDPKIELDLLWVLLPRARSLGRLRELRAELDRALELAEAPERQLALLVLAGQLAREEGRLGAAAELLRPALQLALGQSPAKVATIALELLPVLLRHGDLGPARQLATGLRDRLEAAGPSAALASSLFHLGNLELHDGHADAALAAHERALELRRELGLRPAEGNSLSALGATQLRRGDIPSALAAFSAAEVILGEHGQGPDLAWPLLGRGRALARLGRHVEARAPLKLALELRLAEADPLAIAIARTALGWNELALGRVDSAEALAREATFALSLADQRRERAEAERLLGRVEARRRRFDDATAHLNEALALGADVHGGAFAGALADLLEVRMEASAAPAEIADLRQRLARRMLAAPLPEQAERLDYLLYRSGRYLERHGVRLDSDPTVSLQRAWETLVHTTGFLAAEDRGPFLLNVAEHARIVEAATTEGVATSPGAAFR
jgi:tetratricopeptide (TPR) repeat protein